PPATDASTPPFSVPGCPGSAADMVQPFPAGYCEAQPQATPPTAPARSVGTTYYLHFTLDNSGGVGSGEIFNNHIPIDPPLGNLVSVTKTTPSLNVSRGQIVPYEIVVTNPLGTDLADMSIVDLFPPGFHYVEGSGHVTTAAGTQAMEPTTNGFEMTWDQVGVTAGGQTRLVLALAVGAGVTEGEYTNRAFAISGLDPTVGYSGEASATVRVVPDPTFDCPDVLGKVFDDENRNGMQETGERGLAGIRLVTARGLVATTD